MQYTCKISTYQQTTRVCCSCFWLARTETDQFIIYTFEVYFPIRSNLKPFKEEGLLRRDNLYEITHANLRSIGHFKV